jgi:hypothetical protein
MELAQMLKIEEKVIYKAFGLSIRSEIPLPELLQINNIQDLIDVEIRIKDLTSNWAESLNTQSDFFVDKNKVLFKVPNIAIFLIQDGNKIFVSLMKDYDLDIVRLYILGSCMGALLIQRKIFPLHGSAIAIDGKAYAIIGESGAGKSTLASAFIKKGYQLLTDDVISLSFSGDSNKPIVTPSYPQQKLWKESLNEFGMEIEGYRPLYRRETKFAIPLSDQFLNQSIPLGGVFELIKTESPDLKILQIKNLTRLRMLFFNTYRNSLISKMDLLDWHFKNSTQIINHVNMYQIWRPTTHFTANELVSMILEVIKKEEIKC